MTEPFLPLRTHLPLQASNAGLFISRGQGQHPERVLQSFELIFVKEGCLSMEEAGQSFDVQAGETLLLWPGRPHRGRVPYPANLSFFWIHFGLNPGLPARLQGAAPLAEGALETVLKVPQYARVTRPDHLTLLFRRFLDDQETLGVHPLSASVTLLLMLLEISTSAPAHLNQRSSAALLAGRADALIRSRFHEPLSASSIARELHCHPDSLGRAFRQTYGCTLTDAIHRRRLQQARLLLLESADTIDAVAQRCGFDDVGYFRRLFRRSEGLAPRTFRQTYARRHINTG